MFEDTRQRMNLALETLIAALDGLDGQLDEAEAPGEMTLREQLSHLLGPADRDLPALLRTFSAANPPRIAPLPDGLPCLTAERERTTLAEFADALRLLHRRVQLELGTLPPAVLERRRARIPEWEAFLGTDEVPLETFVLLELETHWMEHAEAIDRLRRR
ncbi:MAG: hypothetical protein U0547_10170 [Dehalococcoidia bacterium]